MCNRYSSESWTTLLVSLPPWRALTKTTNSKISKIQLILTLKSALSLSLYRRFWLSLGSYHQTSFIINFVIVSKLKTPCFGVGSAGKLLEPPCFKLLYQTSLAILSNARKDCAPYYKVLQSDSLFSFKLITTLQIYYIYWGKIKSQCATGTLRSPGPLFW